MGSARASRAVVGALADHLDSFDAKEGGSDHRAVIFLLGEVPIDDLAAGASFIDKAQSQVGLAQFLDEFVQRVEGAADGAVEMNFGVVLKGGGHDD